jgi:hypothetical protein
MECQDSDHVQTPLYIKERIFEKYGPFLDVCPYQSEKDYLNERWVGTVFCNPPYSNPIPFIKKGFWHWKDGNTCIFLLKQHSTFFSAEWVHNYILGKALIYPFNHRIQFQGYSEKARFSNLLVVFVAGETHESIKSLTWTPYGVS